MPLAADRTGPDRVNFSGGLTAGDVRRLVEDPDLAVVQTEADRPVPAATWRLLDEGLFQPRPEVTLRVYGSYGAACDLAFAGTLRHVRRFAADSLLRAVNVEQIARIPRLESLSLGVHSLESFGLLGEMAPTLTHLVLGQTKSKKPDLAPLGRFRDLRSVYVEGHRRNLEVLGTLSALENVTLRSVTLDDLAFLRPLHHMWSLDLKLGGIRDLSGIAGMGGIKYLEIWQVKGLAQVEVASALPGLQDLFLQSLPQVRALPSFAASEKLRRIVLRNMRGLRDLSTLELAPALEDLCVIQGDPLEPEDFLPALRNPRLKYAAAHFASEKKVRRFEELVAQHHQATRRPSPFRIE
jgi:hypothetical protein